MRNSTMKNIKLFVATILLLASNITAFANDYALLDTYPLSNEMKTAKKQQSILDNMHTTIIEGKYDSQKELNHLKNNFNTALETLSKGTEVTIIKNKIEEIKIQWKQDNHLLDASINNEMYKKEAFTSLTQLSKKLASLNKLYKQSYTRYKQNSIMKSLVSSYMKMQEASKPKYALNTP